MSCFVMLMIWTSSLIWMICVMTRLACVSVMLIRQPQQYLRHCLSQVFMTIQLYIIISIDFYLSFSLFHKPKVWLVWVNQFNNLVVKQLVQLVSQQLATKKLVGIGEQQMIERQNSSFLQLLCIRYFLTHFFAKCDPD